MNEKDYEKYVEQVKDNNENFNLLVKLAQEEFSREATLEANSLLSVDSVVNNRMTVVQQDAIRTAVVEKYKKKLFASANNAIEKLTAKTKEEIKKFCKDFSINLPEDGKDHTKDIENALHIVDMLGFNLDVKNLENALAPMRGSFRSVKTVVDLIDAKSKNASFGVGFAPDVIARMFDYMGINNRVYDYLNTFNNIQNILNTPGDKYRFEVTSRDNATVITLQPIIPYDLLCCPDWMRQCGQEYAALEEEFSSLFTGHVLTDKEILEGICYDGKSPNNAVDTSKDSDDAFIWDWE